MTFWSATYMIRDMCLGSRGPRRRKGQYHGFATVLCLTSVTIAHRPASPYFSHILERAWPLMADCYSVSLTDDCTARFFADNANGGCLCRDAGGN